MRISSPFPEPCHTCSCPISRLHSPPSPPAPCPFSNALPACASDGGRCGARCCGGAWNRLQSNKAKTLVAGVPNLALVESVHSIKTASIRPPSPSPPPPPSPPPSPPSSPPPSLTRVLHMRARLPSCVILPNPARCCYASGGVAGPELTRLGVPLACLSPRSPPLALPFSPLVIQDALDKACEAAGREERLNVMVQVVSLVSGSLCLPLFRFGRGGGARSLGEGIRCRELVGRRGRTGRWSLVARCWLVQACSV